MHFRPCIPLLLFAALLLQALSGYCQTPEDSIQALLQNTQGEERVTLLNELFISYRNHEPAQAAAYAHEALTLAREIGFRAGEGQALNALGTYYKNIGDLDQALEHLIASVQLHQELGDKKRIAFSLSNMGIVYTMQENPVKARSSFEQALRYFEELGDLRYIIPALNNLGSVYYEMKNYVRALDYYQHADSLSRESGMGVDFDNLTNLGNIFQQQGNFEEALSYYFRALNYEKQILNVYGIARALYNIGNTYKELGNYQQALVYLNQAADRARTVQDMQLLATVYESLADTHFALNDLIQAYGAMRMHVTYKDSLLNQETSKKLAELETRYELEKKEREIELLRTEDENKSLQIRNGQIRLYAILFTLLSVLALAVLIYSRYRQSQKTKVILEKQNQDIEAAKEIIEEKNRDITDSIQYARTVQEAIIRRNDLSRHIQESFVLYKPKDIVSGDFYWYSKNGTRELIAAVDCTGHGVAGAFMTIIGNSLLNQIVNGQHIYEPAEILQMLDWRVRDTLKHHEMQSTAHGMDVALCQIDWENKVLRYSGAKRPLYYIRNEELHEVKGSKYAISDSLSDHSKQFEEETMPFEPGDTFYLFSDGYADQFGGPKGKKFMVGRFKKLLLQHHQSAMDLQAEKLHIEIDQWMYDTEQTDDMLVIGFRIPKE